MTIFSLSFEPAETFKNVKDTFKNYITRRSFYFGLKHAQSSLGHIRAISPVIHSYCLGMLCLQRLSFKKNNQNKTHFILLSENAKCSAIQCVEDTEMYDRKSKIHLTEKTTLKHFMSISPHCSGASTIYTYLYSK